jgi:hypothetical protein
MLPDARDGVTLMMVHANPVSPEREQEFNDWYTAVHVPELLQLGVVASTRYRIADERFGGARLHRYLAVHEIPTARLDEVLEKIREAQAEGRMGLSPALDGETARLSFFEAITERFTPDQAPAMLADPRYAAGKAKEQPAVPLPAVEPAE